MIKQAALVLLSVLPFGLSVIAAHEVWISIRGIANLWRLILMTLVWIGAFAIGTQIFWKVTDVLASKRL